MLLRVQALVLPIALALIGASLAGPVEARPGVTLGERVTHRITYRLVYTNPTARPATVVLEMPLVGDRGEYQKSRILRLRPGNCRFRRDRWGNPLVQWRREDVPPGRSVTCEVEAEVVRRALLFDVDATRARLPAEPPRRSLPVPEGKAVHPRLAAAARRVVGSESNPFYQMVRLYDFVRSLDFQLTLPDRGDLEVLESGVAQCADAAGLLASLARARGLPARFVGGYYLRADQSALEASHAWIEVYLEPFGWLPFDPTMGRFSDLRLSRIAQLDPNYVAFWQGRESRPFAAAGPGTGQRSAFRIEVQHRRVHTAAPARPLFPVPQVPEGEETPQERLPSGSVLERLKASLRASRSGDLEAAAEWIEQAVDRAPEEPILYRQWCEVARRSGTLRELEETLRRRLKRRRLPAIHYGLALVLLEEGRYSEAESHLERAGNRFEVEHARADLYTRTHQPGRALKAFRRALARSSSPGLEELLVELYLGLQDWAGLAEAARQGARNAPAPAPFLLARAEALFHLGQRSEARELVETLRRQEPDNGLYPGMLGWWSLQTGDREAGRRYLEQALRRELHGRDRQFFQDVLEGLVRE